MMQRNTPTRTAIALVSSQSAGLRVALAALATAAVLVVLVLITGPSSAGYGFV